MAMQLVRRLERGPAFSVLSSTGRIDQQLFNEAEASKQYQMWVRSWVLPDVLSLVPELRDKVRSKVSA
jgi:hypothetical protein